MTTTSNVIFALALIAGGGLIFFVFGPYIFVLMAFGGAFCATVVSIISWNSSRRF